MKISPNYSSKWISLILPLQFQFLIYCSTLDRGHFGRPQSLFYLLASNHISLQLCCVYNLTSADIWLQMGCTTAEKSKSIMWVQIIVAVVWYRDHQLGNRKGKFLTDGISLKYLLLLKMPYLVYSDSCSWIIHSAP